MNAPMQAAVSPERARALANAEFEAAGLRVELPGVVGLVTLRARPQGRALSDAVEAVTGLALPDTLCSTVKDARRLRWMSPDEWLLSCPMEEVASLSKGLAEQLAGAPQVSVTELSGGLCVMMLEGPALREVLAQCVPIDLDPRVFVQDRVASTLFAKAGATLTHVSEGRIELICRRSLADYVLKFLSHAATESGGLSLKIVTEHP